MVKMLVGDEPLENNTGRLNERDRKCKVCQEGEVESSSHFLFTCPTLHSKRRSLHHSLSELVSMEWADNAMRQQKIGPIINRWDDPTEEALHKLSLVAQAVDKMMAKRNKIFLSK